jgi:hypothetical protein
MSYRFSLMSIVIGDFLLMITLIFIILVLIQVGLIVLPFKIVFNFIVFHCQASLSQL